MAGQRHSRVSLSFSEPESTHVRSPYMMHPVSIDACLQSGTPSLWEGYRSSIDAALVPAMIDDLILPSHSNKSIIGVASSTSEYQGIGRTDVARSYKTNVKVHDASSGSLLFQMSSLTYTELNTNRVNGSASLYTHLSWKPDISFLTPGQLNNTVSTAEEMIELVKHKKPILAVMEVDMLGNSDSMFLKTSSKDPTQSAVYRRCLYTSNTASVLLEAQEAHSQNPNVDFDICDIANPQYDVGLNKASFDLLIIKMVRIRPRLMYYFADFNRYVWHPLNLVWC